MSAEAELEADSARLPQVTPDAALAGPGKAGLAAGAELERAEEEALSCLRTRNEKLVRLVLLLLGLGALVAVGRLTGLSASFSIAGLRELVQGAGPWGFLILVGAFTVGLLIQVPGLLFAAVAVISYGSLGGGLAAYLGGTAAVCLVFVLVRLVGGDLLSGSGPSERDDASWAKRTLARAMGQIDEHPIRTVALLRLVFWTSPWLNYALAVSGVRFLPHLIGTLIGLIPIKIAVALFLDRILAWTGLV